MPITAIARTQLAPVSPQWLLDTAHVSHVSPTLSLLRRLPVLKTICCRILVMDNTSRGPMNVYHGSLENPAMWLQYFEVQRCQRGFFHFLSIICKEERSIAWICITSNPQLANSLGLFASQRGVENKAEVQAYTVRTPKKNAPHQNWAKLFED